MKVLAVTLMFFSMSLSVNVTLWRKAAAAAAVVVVAAAAAVLLDMFWSRSKYQVCF